MGLYSRFFAAMYDRFLAATEEAGLADMRAQLVAGARGRTLELGAGTGLNLQHYPSEGVELTLTEPSEPMARRLQARAAGERPAAKVVSAPAERLPFDDASFDSIVSTLVLCTVPDQPAALNEARRVLAPGGTLLFLEHVRSEDPKLARWQDRLRPIWRRVGDGCVCNRDTLAGIRAAGFHVDEVEHTQLPKAAPIVRPLIVGRASATD